MVTDVAEAGGAGGPVRLTGYVSAAEAVKAGPGGGDMGSAGGAKSPAQEPG